ncbi:aldehyde dehydrogenase [Halorubellus sp. JP-L1]|uniref:aldehyde dehydrogenase n=1 Tax=Halorubellus sp. JP-L1 TaxID=2715753 RepID=UPI00140C525C|nr:aldehyde dehydrogenase [Halorubellus sp. JP-L1]NHN42938.1 aldehyde dehydrogenase [Halorubellus sp. JP-L1]
MVETVRTSHYIDGTWRTGTPTIDVSNPATEETIATIPSADEALVEEALSAAQSAQDEWGAMPGVERAEVIRDIGAVIEDHVEDVGDVLMAEQGKPRSAAHGEVTGTLTLADYTAGWGRRIEGDIVPSDNRDEQIQLQRHPMGVVAAIIPWNYPIAVLMRKILPALIAGNAVVVKPSSTTPLATIRVFELLDEELDLPDGLVNLVLGGSTVGDALVTAPDTDMVTMTGSTSVGKKIMEAAAQNLTPVSLELGGKAPAIVAADADVDAAVEDILTARITNAGQVCTCAERVFVHEDVAEEFTDKYVAATDALELGPPESDPEMGPQVTQGELDWTHQSVEAAVESGAALLAGGEPLSGGDFERGFWYPPTVLGDVDPSMDVVEQEVFGPVTPIVTVESVEQAVVYANRSRYGLSSYVFTEDYQTAMRTVEDLDYGETYVNRTLGEAWQGHHIGWNDSGMGGDDGKYGVLKYTQIKSVYHDYS